MEPDNAHVRPWNPSAYHTFPASLDLYWEKQPFIFGDNGSTIRIGFFAAAAAAAAVVCNILIFCRGSVICCFKSSWEKRFNISIFIMDFIPNALFLLVLVIFFLAHFYCSIVPARIGIVLGFWKIFGQNRPTFVEYFIFPNRIITKSATTIIIAIGGICFDPLVDYRWWWYQFFFLFVLFRLL